MARTSWFIGNIKHKVKKKHKTASTPTTTLSLSRDVKLTIPHSGASFGGNDPDQERDPPGDPTPVTFPTHEEAKGRTWTGDDPPPNFQALFSKVVKPADISEQHLEALNITVLPSCSIEVLIPTAPDGSSYLEPPMPDALDDDQKASISEEQFKVHQEKVRKREDFDSRLAELRIDNDLAFRTLSRRVPSGTKPPRIAFMRKFYEGLEGMSQYWDCSLDQYFDVDDSERSEDREKYAKRQRLENGYSPIHSPTEASSLESNQSLPILGAQPQDQSTETKVEAGGDQDPIPDSPFNTRSPSPSTQPPTRKRYKGRRTGTGREMPDQFRMDTVKNFVEGTIWPFRSALSIPRTVPLVQFNKLNIPVRLTAAAYRMPQDRHKARQGFQEGPILSLQVRAETEFENAEGEVDMRKGRLDRLREVAALLQLAQERRREGRSEVRPGEGKWWTMRPRWGGGEGGDAQNGIANADILATAEEMVGAAKEKKETPNSRRAPVRKTPAMLWKELKVGRGNWDAKTDYMAIGKDPASDWDTVFLVSSLNHHISVLKLTIHVAYIDYLATNSLPEVEPEDEGWMSPKLQRTEWFDIFDPEQRERAFRGLWGVMAYLSRDTGESEGQISSSHASNGEYER